MAILEHPRALQTLFLTIIICLFSLPARARYSGGTGEPNDPYQIATAEDLMLLGESPDDYDKHFILMADIDLNPNLPGRKVFDRAVIAPDMNDANWEFDGTPFDGVFDGDSHTISHLTISGDSYLGLFGQLDPGALVSNLGLEVVDVNGIGFCNGSLVGYLGTGLWPWWGMASISDCHSTGQVSGTASVGGLVGYNNWGSITTSYSTGTVIGNGGVGGLIGDNVGTVTDCYSAASVSGTSSVGGLVGENGFGGNGDGWFHPPGTIRSCYATGPVLGEYDVGGLVGRNRYAAGDDDDYNGIAMIYSTGTVNGEYNIGGLVGMNVGDITMCYSTGEVSGSEDVGGLVGMSVGNITVSFWDIETSGQSESDGGTVKTTTEMQTARTFYGWCKCGDEPVWTIDEGNDYPRLYWENKPGEPIEPIFLSDFLLGAGTHDDPYLIYTAEELNLVGLGICDWDKHFKLMADINLSDYLYDAALIGPDIDPSYDLRFQGTPFTGIFDGNGHSISHLTITGGSCLGLFGQLKSGAEVKNLGLVDVNITGLGNYIGSLVGSSRGSVINSYSTGMVSGTYYVGGLVGKNDWLGNITTSYSTGTVSGNNRVGGLVGLTWMVTSPRAIVPAWSVGMNVSVAS